MLSWHLCMFRCIIWMCVCIFTVLWCPRAATWACALRLTCGSSPLVEQKRKITHGLQFTSSNLHYCTTLAQWTSRLDQSAACNRYFHCCSIICSFVNYVFHVLSIKSEKKRTSQVLRAQKRCPKIAQMFLNNQTVKSQNVCGFTANSQDPGMSIWHSLLDKWLKWWTDYQLAQ